MKDFLKYVGAIVMLIGVIILALYHFGNYPGNGLLITAGIFVLAGAIGHIVLNRFIE